MSPDTSGAGRPQSLSGMKKHPARAGLDTARAGPQIAREKTK